MTVPSCRHKFRVLLQLLLILVILPCGRIATASPGAPEGTVIIVIDQQNLPYQTVMDGFQTRLSQSMPLMRLEKIYLSRDTNEQTETLARLKADRPRLILALGSVALEAVSRDVHDIPVLFGLILSENFPKLPDNVSGVYLDFPLEVQFGWLQRVLPEARTVGVIYNRPQNQVKVDLAAQVAEKLGLRLDSHAIASPRELPAALEALANSADVFWSITDRLVVTPQTARSLLLFSFRNRIPLFGLSEAWVKAGALFALDRDYPDIGRQCADLASKILQGAPVASLPPESPRQARLFLNRHIAEQMKLALPASLLETAAKVY